MSESISKATRSCSRASTRRCSRRSHSPYKRCARASVAQVLTRDVPPGPAVSAVLTYRLATYWLPVIPGWAAWRLLQRHDYV
jgi:hypothetical protein